MKRVITVLICGLSIAISSYGQMKTDTFYYDKDWKGVQSKTFATYFRVIEILEDESEDNNYRKRFRDYYITGELQSEGGYITIDKYDDSKSVFDGEWVNYYKSGKVEQQEPELKVKKRANTLNTKKTASF